MTDMTKGEAAASAQASRAEDIFRRYPQISASEIKEAVTFLKKGRHLDIGLVTGNAELKDNIDAFRQEHARALGLGWGEATAFTLFFIAMLAVVIWLLAR